MKTVIYTCPLVPAEWIAAYGLRPDRILPRSPARNLLTHEGVCPFAAAFAHAVCGGEGADAAIFTTACDQMRRMAEPAARDAGMPVFLMNVPSTWQTPAAQRLYMEEIRRLGRFLVACGGSSPDPGALAGVLRTYAEERARRRDARAPDARGIPVALVGGPLMREDPSIFDIVESAGGRIALDASEGGERTVPADVDRRSLDADPFLAMVESYLPGIPMVFQRPNSALYEWLAGEISERGIRGVILRYYTWCDMWHAEARRMKEWLEIPMVAVVSGGDEHGRGHAASRIESFLEMLR